jgi:hypothetical protein
MAGSTPEGVTTHTDDDTVSATTEVDAPPGAVFDFLRRPANHSIISGDRSVQGATTGPELLSMGDKFGMSMKVGVPYRIRSKVVEFDQDRVIAWCHWGRHRWRWTLEPAADGKTRVTETFDLSTAVFPPALRVAGFPGKHEANVAGSVANVAAHFAGR